MIRPQTIFRVKKSTGGYSIVANAPLTDERLSLEARGLLAYLLTKPDDWEIQNNDLKRIGSVGRKKLDRILSELKEVGYLERRQVRLENGTLNWVSFVYESPDIRDQVDPTIVPKGSGGDTPAMVPKQDNGETNPETIVPNRDDETIVPLAADGSGHHVLSTDSPIPEPRLEELNPERQNNREDSTREESPVSATSAVAQLRELGFGVNEALDFAERYGQDRIALAAAIAKTDPEIANPGGWVRKALEEGWDLTSRSKSHGGDRVANDFRHGRTEGDRQRYVTGAFADAIRH